MNWLESGVFCTVHADGCTRNNGYNNEQRFLCGPRQGVIRSYQETTTEDLEDFMCTAVKAIFRVCKPVRLL
jgi:hypothetical protein